MIHTLPKPVADDLRLKDALAKQSAAALQEHMAIVSEMLGLKPEDGAVLDIAAGTITIPDAAAPTAEPLPESLPDFLLPGSIA